jgi:hypothetical protein
LIFHNATIRWVNEMAYPNRSAPCFNKANIF